MFNDIARVRDHPWTDDLAVWNLDGFEQMILMFMSRVGSFKTERSGCNLEHMADDVR
jgi:hypothetical protein